MKKRLIVIFVILAIVVVIIVLNSIVFTLQQAEVSVYDEEGKLTATPPGINPTELVKDFIGKNIFFLDEEKLIDSLHSNEAFREYFCISVERVDTSTVVLHVAKRQPVFYISYSNTGYLIDNLGYCTATEESSTGYVNLGNFSTWVGSISVGSNVVWNGKTQTKFNLLCAVASTVWRFNYNYADVAQLIKGFSFNDDTTLQIDTVSGAVIRIKDCFNKTSDKVITAVSIYYDSEVDNTTAGTLIEINEKGRAVTTSNK